MPHTFVAQTKTLGGAEQLSTLIGSNIDFFLVASSLECGAGVAVSPIPPALEVSGGAWTCEGGDASAPTPLLCCR